MVKTNVSDIKDINFGQEVANMLGAKVGQAANIIDPYEFVFDLCYTLDPHDHGCPIKRFPQQDYIKVLIKEWLTCSMMLVVKSRQMIVSWLFCALHLWLATQYKGQIIYFISKKEDDAGLARQLSLLSRVKFMYDRLPPKAKIRHKLANKPPKLSFPTMESEISGLSQDSDAVRSYTASAIMCDEWSFQERAEETYAAMNATLEGGGRLVGVSTPNGKRNLFYRLVHDVKKEDD